MGSSILVLGGESLVGAEVVRQLTALGHGYIAPKLGWQRPQSAAFLAKRFQQVFLGPPSYFSCCRINEKMIETLGEMGARKIVLLSSFEAGLGVKVGVGEAYRRLEEKLTTSQMAYTILRAAPLMQELTTIDPPYPVREKSLKIPYGEARSAFVDARDVASAAVKALTDTGHSGRVYTITGPEALGLGEVAEAISTAAQTRFLYEHTEVPIFRSRLRALDYPDDVITAATEFYGLCRKGAAEHVSSSVGKIIGRSAITFSRFVRDYREKFAA